MALETRQTSVDDQEVREIGTVSSSCDFVLK